MYLCKYMLSNVNLCPWKVRTRLHDLWYKIVWNKIIYSHTHRYNRSIWLMSTCVNKLATEVVRSTNWSIRIAFLVKIFILYENFDWDFIMEWCKIMCVDFRKKWPFKGRLIHLTQYSIKLDIVFTITVYCSISWKRKYKSLGITGTNLKILIYAGHQIELSTFGLRD